MKLLNSINQMKALEVSNEIKTLSDRGSQCRMVRVGERQQTHPVGITNGVRLKQDYLFR